MYYREVLWITAIYTGNADHHKRSHSDDDDIDYAPSMSRSEYALKWIHSPNP